MLQQGDVLLKKIESLPVDGRPVARKERGFILADGEVTGHAHVITDEVVDVKLVEKNGVLYLGCDGDVIVRHEEHGHITVPAGNYEVGRVREYDHFAEEARQVQD